MDHKCYYISKKTNYGRIMSSPAVTLKFPLQEFFPKSEYKEACAQNKKLVPQYLIALGQPTATILKSAEKHPDYRDPQYGLTALAVATLSQNHEVMEALMSRKDVNPLSEDVALLTPLHYAEALQDQKSIQLINTALKTRKLASVNFSGWQQMFNPTFPAEQREVYFHINDEGKVVPGTVGDFKKQTGAIFYDNLVSSRENWVANLAQRIKIPKQTSQPLMISVGKALLQDLGKFQAQPPKLYLGEQKGAGLGLFAGQPLKHGQLCTIYGGEIDLSRAAGDYTLGFEHADKYRNMAGMINDGFPNLISSPIILPDGRIFQSFLASVDIPEGAPIFWDYGKFYSFKQRGYLPLNLSEMESYIKQHGLLKLMQLVEKNVQEQGNTTLEKLSLKQGTAARISYILNTPSTLVYLLLKKIISSEELDQCLKHPMINMLIAPGDEDYCAGHIPFLGQLNKMTSDFQELIDQCDDPKLKQEFTEEIYRLLETHGIRFLVNFTAIDFQYASLTEWKNNHVDYTHSVEAIASISDRFFWSEQSAFSDAYITQCATALAKVTQKLMTNLTKSLVPIFRQYPERLNAYETIIRKMQSV